MFLLGLLSIHWPSRRHSRNSRCTRCGKKFTREEDVLNHMNQPWSKCASWMHDLVKISDAIDLPHRKRNESPELSHSRTLTDDGFGMDIEMPVTDEHHTPGTLADTMWTYVEEFPGAGCTYGNGETFMNLFDTDQHAHHRTHNLYYPFASKAEWQLASWLLRSNLSMQAIDEFLLLDLVSQHIFIIIIINANVRLISIFRSNNFRSHFAQLKSCVEEQKCCPRGHNGSVDHGQQVTLPSGRLTYISAMPLSV